MTAGTLLTIFAAVVFLVLFLGGLFLTFYLVWKKFNKASGFSDLARLFPAYSKPRGVDFPLRTIAIGSVRYRNCVYITVAGEGLFIRLRSVFPLLPKNPPLLIPWDKLRTSGETKIYFRTAYCLDVGEPKVATISVLEDVFSGIRPYLRSKD